MKYIGFDELNPNYGFPLLKDSLCDGPYEIQDIILEYLKSGTVELAQVSRRRDIFTNELIPLEVLIMTDGIFSWNSILIWYVQKYNLRLPQIFEEHILDKYHSRHQ